MAAGNTYTQIASTTLGSAAASVTFSSIAGTYTDLVLVINATAAGTFTSQLVFNSDNSSTLYSHTDLVGNGTSATSTRTSGGSGYLAILGNVYTTQTNFIAHIMNYANATTFKTTLSRSNNAGNRLDASVSLWRNTNAITSVRVENYLGSDQFAAGSTFNLYGITAA